MWDKDPRYRRHHLVIISSFPIRRFPRQSSLSAEDESPSEVFFPDFLLFSIFYSFFRRRRAWILRDVLAFSAKPWRGEEEEVERRGRGRGRRWSEGRRMMRKRELDGNEEKGNACIKIREFIFIILIVFSCFLRWYLRISFSVIFPYTPNIRWLARYPLCYNSN